MRSWAGVVVAGLAGCASFENVDDACKENLPGDSYGSDEADAFFQRLDCYRRYAGVDRPAIDKGVTEATEAHAAYLSQNGTGYDWSIEEPGQAGYTGADGFERLNNAGFPLEAADTLVWQVVLPADPSRPRAEMVDFLVHDPFTRDVLFAPGWLGGGYAEGTELFDGLAYAMWALALPSAEHSNKPVLWPAEDMEAVPVSYFGGGYPVTMTFGSSTLGSNPDNPLDVILKSSTITAEDGTVIEHEVVLPGFIEYVGPNHSTVILAPLQPLAPDTLYTVEAEVEWISYPDGRTLEWSFLTGTEIVDGSFFE